MMYKKFKGKTLNSEDLLNLVIPIGLVCLLIPVLTELLSILATTVKVFLRIN